MLQTVTQPLSRPVSSNDISYAEKAGYSKLGWRHFRRATVFAASGQKKYLHSRVDPVWKKAIWIYKGIPQIGDSLMDLAPRSLLHELGFQIDLYTDPHLATLYEADPWFCRVLHEPEKLASADYDFVIMPSHKYRSLKVKARLLEQLPWVSIHGFYTGPDFHRSRFATQRLLDLLGLAVDAKTFDRHESPKLVPLATAAHTAVGHLRIALALGGVNPPRTYQHWAELAKALSKQMGPIEVTLLGSANAIEAAEAFVHLCDGHFPVINHVGKTSLAECRALINAQDLFVASDGGLMHIGATTPTPMVSLFNSEISPLCRLSGQHESFALQSATTEVSTLAIPEVLALIQRALAAR